MASMYKNGGGRKKTSRGRQGNSCIQRRHGPRRSVPDQTTKKERRTGETRWISAEGDKQQTSNPRAPKAVGVTGWRSRGKILRKSGATARNGETRSHLLRN